MSIFNALNAAIYTKLSGGTALTTALGGTAIYYQQAPDGKELPFVIWSYQGGGDENITPSRMKNNLIFIRTWADDPKEAGQIDKLIDDLLHNQTLSVTGWTNYWMAREDDLSLIENEPNGEKSYMAGGMYRIRLST